MKEGRRERREERESILKENMQRRARGEGRERGESRRRRAKGENRRAQGPEPVHVPEQPRAHGLDILLLGSGLWLLGWALGSANSNGLDL